MAAPLYIPTSKVRGFQFICVLVNSYFCLHIIKYSHPGWCEIIPHSGFDFVSLMSKNVFMWLLALCKSLEHVYSNRLLIFFTQYSSFPCSLLRVLFIFWMLYPYQTWFSNISSHSADCRFTFLVISLDGQRCLILLKSHLPIFKKNIYSAFLGLRCSTWDLASWPGFEPRHLHWECGILATGPTGKLYLSFFWSLWVSYLRSIAKS